MSELEYEYRALNDMRKMEKLLKNKDFKDLFIDGFMKEDLQFLGLNVANTPADSRNKLVEQMLARGILKQYIDGIIVAGKSAEEAVAEYENGGQEDE